MNQMIGQVQFGDYTIKRFKSEGKNSFPIKVYYGGEYVGQGKNKKHLKEIAKEIGISQSDNDTVQDLGRKIIRSLSKKARKINNAEQDYSNFYHMLQFWIEQINNNIENTGKRVAFKEIVEENVENAEEVFKDPKFNRRFLEYTEFSVYISFFRNGQYKGTKANWVMWKAPKAMTGWLNICYDYNQQMVTISLNSDNKDMEQYLRQEGYMEGEQYLVEELELFKEKPNEIVKELFDYYSGLIYSAKKYLGNGKGDMLIKELRDKLEKSHNIIFRGAPGTGKSYLAKEIATDIISNGYYSDYTRLTDEQKEQVEFVQFHPSYDYSDFVEGLRPKINDDGSMGFELKDGVFKRFVARARKNYEDSQKSQEVIEKEASVKEILDDYFSDIELGVEELEIARGNKFYITSVDERHINIAIPGNEVTNRLSLITNELKEMLESEQRFSQVKDVTRFFGKTHATQNYSYNLAIYNAIKARKAPTGKIVVKQEKAKPYIFIIDEINRGEISKIFGELFFSIDPGYRGQAGAISTQYANMHEDPSEKFFISPNVYIIGTMNDIDRSVDSFDFAMRRRFRFIEIKADDRLEMLDALGESKEEAIERMTVLNNAISEVDELNENYHIGASYFLKLRTMDFDQLWMDYLKPLLQDYVRGMYDEEDIMKKFAEVYGYGSSQVGESNDGD